MNIVLCSDGRCGSLWLAFTIGQKLRKSFGWLDEGFPEEQINMTHVFSLIENFEGVVIHCTRRNIIEHFIATVFYDRIMKEDKEWVNFANVIGIPSHIHNDDKRRPVLIQKFRELVERTKFTVYKSEFEEFIKIKKQNEQIIESYPGHKQTIYYEDLFEGVDIPSLELKNITFKQRGAFVKLPYDKKEITVNYSEIETWFN